MYLHVHAHVQYIPFSDHGILQSSFFEARHPIINYQLGRKLYCSERNRRARSLDKAIGILWLPPTYTTEKEFVLYCTVQSCPIHFEDSSE